MAKKNIYNLIRDVVEVAKKNKWERSYNKDADFFCWTKKSLSKGVRLVKISRETILYINKSAQIEGLGIEYWKDNFIAHHNGYKGLTDFFTENIGSGIFVVPKSKEDIIDDKLGHFTQDLLLDIYDEHTVEGRTIEDIQSLIDTAISH